MEDPSGNSFIQNPNAPNKDNYLKTDLYARKFEDYALMGYSEEQAKSVKEIDE